MSEDDINVTGKSTEMPCEDSAEFEKTVDEIDKNPTENITEENEKSEKQNSNIKTKILSDYEAITMDQNADNTEEIFKQSNEEIQEEESEDEDVVKSKHKVQKKRMHFDDSDEESNNEDGLIDKDEIMDEENRIDDQEPDLSNGMKVVKKSRLIQLCDSDSDSDGDNKENEKPEESDKENDDIFLKVDQKIKRKLLNVFTKKNTDSDKENLLEADEENVFSKTNTEENQLESDEENLFSKTSQKDNENIFASENPLEFDEEHLISQEKKQRLMNLCDSESSADEKERQEQFEHRQEVKKKVKKTKDFVDKPMSGREAVEQRRVIQSESQRMVRESGVHLPYHRPKAHTLQEFLKRKSRIEIKAPPNTPTTFCIKMSADKLAATAKRMEEHEKETEIFFKSDEEDELEPLNNLIDNVEESAIKKESAKGRDAESDNGNQLKETDLNYKNMEIDINSEEILDNIDKQIELNIEKVNGEVTELNSMSDSSNHDNINAETSNRKSGKPNLENSEHNSNSRSLILEGLNSDSSDFEILNDNTRSEILNFVNSNNANLHSEYLIQENLNNDSTNPGNTNIKNKRNLNNDSIITECVNETTEKENSEIVPNDETSESSQKEEESKIQELRETLEKYIGNSTNQNESNMDSTKDLEPQENEKEINLDKTEPTLSEIYKLKLKQKIKQYKPLVNVNLNFQPRLSGGPNDLVELDDEIEKKKGINKLMQRFVAHTAKKVSHKKHEVKITNVINGIIRQETIKLKDNEEELEDEPARKFQTPGEKMKKLRKELEEQITKTREEEWKRLKEKEKDNEEVYAGERTECGLVDEVLDNDEEEDMTDTDPSSESEEEEDEEDVEMKEKPRVKSAFVDDEAEDSEGDEDKENDPGTNAQTEDDTDEDSDDESDSEEENKESEASGIRKPLRRILTTFDDSDDEVQSAQKSAFTSVDLFTSQEKQFDNWDDEDIPAYQPQSGLKTPCRPETRKSQDLTFLTPTFHLTALQGMNTGPKSLEGSPVILLPPEPSPLKSYSGLKTKLFDDQNTEDLDELEGLCSGRFIGTLEKNKSLSTMESELMDMCSGKFDGLTQFRTDKTNEEIEDLKTAKDGEVDLIATNKDNTENKVKQLQTAHRRIEFDDFAKLGDIGGLEDLNIEKNEDNLNGIMELQDSQVSINKFSSKQLDEYIDKNADSHKNIFETNTQSDQTRPKFILATSSEDETHEESRPKKKKKFTKKKRRYIIDDISITDEDEDLYDEFSDLEGENENVGGSKNVNYDSEENEIDLEEERIQKQKAREFFEAEAELSGSDWGSADEDEKDLDDLEFEAGDDENINEKKVQRELERMHVRQVLDEDKRDVKLLQELLLEDGELHGTGREKKFKWKNADSFKWNETDKPKDEDDDEEVEEIESELQWRKARHEREMFLKEVKLKNQVLATEEEILGKNSQILNFGKNTLKIALPGSQSGSNTPNTTPIDIPESKSIFSLNLLNKRGSFLGRSEQTLTRLAQMTKSTSGLNGARNSRNFVFQTIDKSKIEENHKKRKAEPGTPKVLKKLRIGEFSPALQRFKKNPRS